MKSGIGLLPFTLDCKFDLSPSLPTVFNVVEGSQIAYIGSPLVVPTWAILNILASLVFWIYIITPALYYSNVWSTAYFPIQSNSIFDNQGHEYNVSKVINKLDGFTINIEKYHEYSHVSNHTFKSEV